MLFYSVIFLKTKPLTLTQFLVKQGNTQMFIGSPVLWFLFMHVAVHIVAVFFFFFFLNGTLQAFG